MTDLEYMEKAYQQALIALEKGEVPVGAVIVKENRIISRSYNKKESTKDATNHAEVIAIKKACKKIKDWRLNGCTLYVTLKPCTMCLGAIMEARIERVIYGVDNTFEKSRITAPPLLEVFGPISEEKNSRLLKSFFKQRRGEAKKMPKK